MTRQMAYRKDRKGDFIFIPVCSAIKRREPHKWSHKDSNAIICHTSGNEYGTRQCTMYITYKVIAFSQPEKHKLNKDFPIS